MLYIWILCDSTNINTIIEFVPTVCSVYQPSVPRYLREEEKHKPDPWCNRIEINHMGFHLEKELLKPRQSFGITLYIPNSSHMWILELRVPYLTGYRMLWSWHIWVESKDSLKQYKKQSNGSVFYYREIFHVECSSITYGFWPMTSMIIVSRRAAKCVHPITLSTLFPTKR